MLASICVSIDAGIEEGCKMCSWHGEQGGNGM